MGRSGIALLAAAAICWCAPVSLAALPAGQEALAGDILKLSAVPGGLCVHLGCGDGTLTASLSADGRFLVHGLEPNAALADAAIRFIRSRGIYGQVWAERYSDKELPYCENLVNLLVVDDLPGTDVPIQEIMRVLCPGGVAVLGQCERAAAAGKKLDLDSLKRRLADAGVTDVQVVERNGIWVRLGKPRPSEMDDWGHPRHGASGNAVSLDALVGPPQRIRWISGPMHEASNMVVADGRLFHSGVIARDAFNGLPLWQSKLDPSPMRLGYPASAIRGSVQPIAADGRLLVVSGGRLQSLDAASGKLIREYGEAGTPLEILYDRGTILTADANTVRGIDAESAKLLWSQEAVQPAGMVAGDGSAFFLEGEVFGGARSIVKLDLSSGKTAWRRGDYAWAGKVRQLSYHKGRLVCEVSSFSNDRAGNGIHVLDARDGTPKWERLYEPGQNHYMQGRALQTDERVWVLTKGKWEGLDPATGTVTDQYPAGENHCYPPAATRKFLLGGEMGLTDIATGRTETNRISKGACSRDTGFVPANGLLYTAPKHCACYPMLKGYSALAPAKSPPGPGARKPEPADFVPQRGPAWAEPLAPAEAGTGQRQDWPCYRADAWRSASATADVPTDLEVLWTTEIGGWPRVALAGDWADNLFSRGPVTAPVIADGMVIVAQPEGHRVVALDARTGGARWDFTANGRVDSPPTIWRGLCLFGTRSGWVYCLRAADGRLVWRLRAAPEEQRIVSYGQIESPWPVAGSVLVVKDTAYFAAGRHPLADGGIRVLAVDPASGAVKWVSTVTSLPLKFFYGGAALEFDPIDLLTAEVRRPVRGTTTAPWSPTTSPAPIDGPVCVAMSRWQFDPATGESNAVWGSGFGLYRTGGAGVMAPRGLWTYGPRMDYIASGPNPAKPDFVASKPRALAAFRAGMLLASSEDKRRCFRRDFSPRDLGTFNDVWFSQRTLPKRDSPGDRDRSERLARGATWTSEVFDGSEAGQGIGALVLAGDTVLVAGTRGGLLVLSAADGKTLARKDLPAPVWDGMASAGGRLYVSTQNGNLVCLGKK